MVFLGDGVQISYRKWSSKPAFWKDFTADKNLDFWRVVHTLKIALVKYHHWESKRCAAWNNINRVIWIWIVRYFRTFLYYIYFPSLLSSALRNIPNWGCHCWVPALAYCKYQSFTNDKHGIRANNVFNRASKFISTKDFKKGILNLYKINLLLESQVSDNCPKIFIFNLLPCVRKYIIYFGKPKVIFFERFI